MAVLMRCSACRAQVQGALLVGVDYKSVSFCKSWKALLGFVAPDFQRASLPSLSDRRFRLVSKIQSGVEHPTWSENPKQSSSKDSNSAAEDLEALCGSLYDIVHVDDAELHPCGGGSDVVPDELWKVSKTCLVSEVMTTDAGACGPDDIIKDVVDRLSSRSGIPVVTEDGTVVGMITRKVRL